MTQRPYTVSLAFAAMVVGGCASDAKPSDTPKFAQDSEVAVQFQALTAVECNSQAVTCLIEHPLRPGSCTLQLADCLASSAIDSSVDLAECTLENAGCSLDAAADASCEDLVDCQQDVARCVSNTVKDVTGVDVDPALDELDPAVDKVGETCGKVVDVAGQVAGVVEDTAQDTVENALDALSCANDARACVRENPREWLPCQVDFAACNAQVAGNAADDVRDTVNESGDIAQGVADDVTQTVSDSVDCAAAYRACRSEGGDYWSCSSDARACELDAL